MLLLLAKLAQATPSGPMPTVERVGADCTDASPTTLEITFQEVVMTCAPGGPCSVLQDEPLDASELWVSVQGCEAPWPGRFKATRKSCEGRPVWRYSTELAPGAEVAVSGRAGLGWMTVPGEGPVSCPPEKPAKVREIRTVDHPVTERRVLLDAQTATLTQTEEGATLSWDSRISQPGAMPYGAQFLTGAAPSTFDPEGLQGTLVIEQSDRVVEVQHYRSTRCETRRSTRGTLTLDGTEVVLSASGEHSWSNPGECT